MAPSGTDCQTGLASGCLSDSFRKNASSMLGASVFESQPARRASMPCAGVGRAVNMVFLALITKRECKAEVAYKPHTTHPHSSRFDAVRRSGRAVNMVFLALITSGSARRKWHTNHTARTLNTHQHAPSTHTHTRTAHNMSRKMKLPTRSEKNAEKEWTTTA